MAKQYLVNKYKSEVVIRTGTILGQGSYAAVSLACLNGVQIAIKSFKNQLGGSCLYNEVNILSRVAHANVIKLIGVIDEDFDVSPKLLLEYLGHGSLAEFSLQQNLPETLELKLLLDVAKGMTYIHDMDIIHRDIASRNVILDMFQNAKVADFGFSVLLPERHNYHQCFEFTNEELSRIPYRHMPKEAVNGLRKTVNLLKATYSKSVDVYSFAVLIWELLFPGKRPYRHFENHQKHEIVEVIYNGHHPAVFENINSSHPTLRNLMLSIFECDQFSRPTFCSLRQNIEQNLLQVQESLKISEQGNKFQFKCPAPPEKFCDDVQFTRNSCSSDSLFTSTSGDSGYSGSSSSSSSSSDMSDSDMEAMLDPEMDSAIVFQNVATVLPDLDFGKAVLKKFGKSGIKLNGLRRLNSRSISIGFKSKEVETSQSFRNSIQAMVNRMKSSPDVWQCGVKVTPVFKKTMTE